MRERFELHCKTIGLILFCAGAYYALSSGFLLVQGGPDVTKMVPASTRQALGRSNMADLQAATSYVREQALKSLLLLGIAPILMGIYLMRSNNLFVRLCYPATAGPLPSAPGGNAPAQLNVPPKAPGKTDDKRSDSRYAPPGYSR